MEAEFRCSVLFGYLITFAIFDKPFYKFSRHGALTSFLLFSFAFFRNHIHYKKHVNHQPIVDYVYLKNVSKEEQAVIEYKNLLRIYASEILEDHHKNKYTHFIKLRC